MLGLKPSLRFHSVGSMRVPSAFEGIPASGSATRRPVALADEVELVPASSEVVYASEGKGRRQFVVSNGSHPAPSSSTRDNVCNSLVDSRGAMVVDASSPREPASAARSEPAHEAPTSTSANTAVHTTSRWLRPAAMLF